MKRLFAAVLAILLLNCGVYAAEIDESGMRLRAFDYLVTYEPGQHGTLQGEATEIVHRREYPCNVPELTAEAGYDFLGWSQDGKTTVDPTKIKIMEETTFTALYEKIEVKNTYVQGNVDGAFRPGENATRCELAAMLARLTNGFDPEKEYAGEAPDVPDGAWYSNFVRFCIEKGYVGGYEDGTFRPGSNITRGEFAVMLGRYLQLEERAVGGFTDISGHWAAGYINALQKAGVVNGYGDGTFHPGDLLTRAEAVSMINRAVGLIYDSSVRYHVRFTDVPPKHWAYPAIMAAANTDISLILK